MYSEYEVSMQSTGISSGYTRGPTGLFHRGNAGREIVESSERANDGKPPLRVDPDRTDFYAGRRRGLAEVISSHLCRGIN